LIVGASEKEETFCAEAFLNNPTLLYVLDGCERIQDITVLGEQLFVLPEWTNIVKVYNTINLKLTHQLKSGDSLSLYAIVACAHNNCLYISRYNQLYRFDLQLKAVTNRWSVDGRCVGLSVTRSHTLLVTFSYASRIKEYTADGVLIREIRPDSSIKDLQQCIQLSNDQFVACSRSRESKHASVNIIDMNGCIVQSYSNPAGSDVGPVHRVAADTHSHVIVPDCYHDRVELLSPTLTHLGYIQIPGYKLDSPCALHLDELTHRLYIGEYFSGRLFVLGDNSIRNNADVVKKNASACTIS